MSYKCVCCLMTFGARHPVGQPQTAQKDQLTYARRTSNNLLVFAQVQIIENNFMLVIIHAVTQSILNKRQVIDEIIIHGTMLENMFMIE